MFNKGVYHIINYLLEAFLRLLARFRKEVFYMGTKIFVGNLDYTVSSDDLKQHFSDAGKIVDAVVITDRMTQRSRGFGFVEFSTADEAKQAVEKLNGSELKGRKINVNEARAQQ